MRLPWLLLAAVSGALLLAACTEDEPPPEADPQLARIESIETEDGLRLDARHFAASGERLVILLHMYPADQSSWYGFAEELQALGLDALTLDFRGFGDSDGDKDPGDADRDVRAALAFARARGFERIVLVGASLGGTAAIVAAAEDAEGVDGVATLSAPLAMNGLDAEDVIADVRAPITLIAAEGDLSGAESLGECGAPRIGPRG
jgi:pimeloyl-ACP methyl ester carboxylesterase